MFDRLGAETKADTTTGNKVSGEPLGTLKAWSSLSVIPGASCIHLTLSHVPFQSSALVCTPCLSATLISLPISIPRALADPWTVPWDPSHQHIP